MSPELKRAIALLQQSRLELIEEIRREIEQETAPEPEVRPKAGRQPEGQWEAEEG
jgi:hypothetical protein